MKMSKQEETSLIRNVLNKCKYSLQGLNYCFRNESSFLFVTLCACLIIICGICFDIDFLEWVISFGSLALIIVIELINTAIEATVDMFTNEYNEFAKIAKDCGSAATGLMSTLALIANLIIFIPYFIKLFMDLIG